MQLQLDQTASSQRIENLLKQLFPIHRTLVNQGYADSLEIIKKSIPISVKEYDSGSQVLDWIIPNSWNVREAYIADSNGNRIIDFQDNNLHLSAYSIPFQGEISHEELMKHLNFRADLPEAIPYNFHYYKKHWSFNVSQNQLNEKFNHEHYQVHIDIDEYPDKLRVGELYVPGETEEEILITTYMCHPSMANDNLSGVVVATELFNQLRNQENLKYSYRLIIVPETIGAITYLAHHEQELEKIKAGFTVYCCGDSGTVHYKKSYSGENYIDKVFDYTLKQIFDYQDESILDFWPGGSDERQFNGTGFRLPMGSVTRSPAAEFKEYHTSLDNLELIKTANLYDTLEKLWSVLAVIEHDTVFKNLYKGEPCFSRHNIEYPTFSDALSKSSAYYVKILANEIDGVNSLMDISLKWGINIFDLYEIAVSFEREGLVKKLN